MARTKISLPSSINDEDVRILWYNIKNLSGIALDLEEAIQNSENDQKRSIPQYQQNILMFIRIFNQGLNPILHNSIREHIKVQNYWLHLLSSLIREIKAGKLTEQQAKELVKKECIYYFRTDEDDYKIIDEDLENKKITISEYKTLLMEKINENEYRKGGPFEKYPYLVSDNFKNRDIDTFINEAWEKRQARKSNQGPEEEAKFVLNYILKRGLSKKKSVPIFFYNEEQLDDFRVLARLVQEFQISPKNKKKIIKKAK